MLVPELWRTQRPEGKGAYCQSIPRQMGRYPLTEDHDHLMQEECPFLPEGPLPHVSVAITIQSDCGVSYPRYTRTSPR